MHLLQHLQHTYVRGAACAAAAQHQADPGRPCASPLSQGAASAVFQHSEAHNDRTAIRYKFPVTMPPSTISSRCVRTPCSSHSVRNTRQALADPVREILGPVRRPRPRIDETAALQFGKRKAGIQLSGVIGIGRNMPAQEQLPGQGQVSGIDPRVQPDVGRAIGGQRVVELRLLFQRIDLLNVFKEQSPSVLAADRATR